MKEPTLEEIEKLVTFKRDAEGNLVVLNVKGNVGGSVCGSVGGSVLGNVGGSVGGSVCGSVCGSVWHDVGVSVCGNVKGNVKGNVRGSVKGVQKPNSNKNAAELETKWKGIRMSGTPRTDEQVIQFGDGPAKYVYAAFADQLEREIRQLEVAAYNLKTENDELRRALKLAFYGDEDATKEHIATAKETGCTK